MKPVTTFKPGIEQEPWFPAWKRKHFPELCDDSEGVETPPPGNDKPTKKGGKGGK